MYKSEFHIKKMDCPSEESLIRTKLSELDTIKSLQFDIKNRTLDVIHDGEVTPIKHLIEELNLGSTKEGKNAKEIHDRLVAVYNDTAPSYATVTRWHKGISSWP